MRAAGRAVLGQPAARTIPYAPDPSVPERLVPLICPGGTVAILASGPSLVAEDVAAVTGRTTVIAINDALWLAPDAEVFYSGAKAYWNPRHEKGLRVAQFRGLKIRICLDQDRPGIGSDGVIRLRNAGPDGFERVPNGVRHYNNSGGAAINVAVHLGATRIILLGYDMAAHGGRHHFHETYPTHHGSPYPLFRQAIATMVPHLAELGVEVVNCSRQTALTCFPRKPLDEVLGC